MTFRPLRPLIALAAVATAVSVAAPMSGAVYTSSSTNPANTLRAAADWVGPVVAVTNPGSPLRGTVNVAATATDAPSGVASVRLQRSTAGAASWSDICTDTTSPYACPWTTTGVADGRYDLRAIATDLAGNVSTSAVVADRLVDNTAPTAVLADSGSAIRGTVTLATTSTDAGSGIASVRYERAPSETTTWTTICTVITSPYGCVFNTTALANGDYDLRITVTDAAGNSATDIATVNIDNLAPTVNMVDPGTPLSGVVTLTANATDAHAGVDTVTIQRAPNGTTAWTDVCTTEEAPYSCRLDTRTIVDGSYSLRAVATDLAGNVATSATVTNRRVDNSISSISLDDPGTFLRGSVTIAANANSTSGVASVRIERRPTGATTWTAICTDTTSPYSCTFDSAAGATPDGGYDFRAVMTTGSGATLTSAIITNRAIDNAEIRALDVDGINRAGGTVGRLETDDTLVLTFSGPMRPSNLIPGWTGEAPATVHARLRDGASVGGASTADVLQLTGDQNGTVATGLGTVNLRTDSINTGKVVSFASTATLATVAVDGRNLTVVTIVFGTQTGGNGHMRTRTNATAMTWTPGAAARDIAGNPISTAPATESGTLDANF